MPILIVLLFYINDLVKIKRYYSQTEFVAQQMANILQNIAKTRAVTKNDIKRAASLAYLTIYPGTTMHSTDPNTDRHTLNHQPRANLYYVRGESNGNASVVWAFYVRPRQGTNPQNWIYSKMNSYQDYGYVRRETDVPPSSIYPTLKIEKDGSKIILETQIQCFLGNQSRKAFGLYLVNPRGIDNEAYFTSVVIFSPNDGFSDTEPK